MGSDRFTTRFAPSPTGLLQLGNVRTALFNFLQARRMHGSFLLRLEDTDAMRGHEKYASALLADLRWLDLRWDEGPEVGGSHAPYVQSQRGAVYQEYFETLSGRHLAYPCFCTENELAVERRTQIAAGRPPRYSGRCRGLSAVAVEERFAKGQAATLRFRVAEGQVVEFDDKVRGPQRFDGADIGDFVIRRSDGTPAFFFCNAVDDALMEVRLVMRGEDHLTNTPRQILLLRALDLPVSEYAHVALVVGADGAPLSKRSGSRSVQELREAGYLPIAILNYLARLGHTYESNALMDLAALAANFSVERLHKASARYDEAHLLHWQKEAVRHASVEKLSEWMTPETRALVPASRRAEFVDTVRPNIVFPGDAHRWAAIFFTDDLELTQSARDDVAAAPPGFFTRVLENFRDRPDDPTLFGKDLPVPPGTSKAVTFRLLRAALTNSAHGPEFVRIHGLLSRERIEKRLQRAVELSNKAP